jgi:endonuclease/exonuclease/phosphatase family metal-dependent hydrolase
MDDSRELVVLYVELLWPLSMRVPHHVYGRTDTTTEDKSRSEIHEETNPVPKRRCDRVMVSKSKDRFVCKILAH